jgi:hypothetical protein
MMTFNGLLSELNEDKNDFYLNLLFLIHFHFKSNMISYKAAAFECDIEKVQNFLNLL